MRPNNRPPARELLADITKEAKHYGCDVATHTLEYKAGNWRLMRIADRWHKNPKGIFLLTTGIHGTETAGPLTVQQRFPHILAATRAAGLQLVCYPLVNPSGWDNDTDLNIDGDGGSAKSNNDFLRCRELNGPWTWKLPEHNPVWEWCWSSNPQLGIHLPLETTLMHKLLEKEDWSNIKVAADIHSDHLNKSLPAGAYQYVFGDPSRYIPIIDQNRTLTSVLGNYDFQFDRDNPEDVVCSDANGCIVFHDGSISDLAHRLGVPDSVALETTAATELQTAMEVYMMWINGLCKPYNS